MTDNLRTAIASRTVATLFAQMRAARHCEHGLLLEHGYQTKDGRVGTWRNDQAHANLTKEGE